MKWDAKTLTAVAALVAALSGAVELRVQVGLLAGKVERIERIVEGSSLYAARNP